MSEQQHHPDCPARYFADHPERCRCVFMAMLDRDPMTPPPPTQPPAAPESDVRLTEAERIALDAAVGALGSEDYPGVLFDEAERIVAERLRVVEGERDALRVQASECERVCLDLVMRRREATARAESAEAAHEALRADALGLLPDECWVTRHDFMRCTDMIGGGFESGAKWTEGMCCLPCRLRALLAGGDER